MGNVEKAPAGAGTAVAVGRNGESSCGSGHYSGSGKIDSAPVGAVTAGAVGKYREDSCWSRHCCGSGEK